MRDKYKVDRLIDRLVRNIDRIDILFDHIHILVDQYRCIYDRPKQTPSSEDKPLVIQKRLQGKSINQIVRETGISKGKVQYLTISGNRKWILSVDEIQSLQVWLKDQIYQLSSVHKDLEIINILENRYRKYGYC